MKTDNLIKLYNYGSLVHQLPDSQLDTPIETDDGHNTTLREVLTTMLDIYNSEI